MNFNFFTAFVLMLSAFLHQASAGVVITGTRVIYPSDKEFVSVELTNVGNTTALVQSWVDTKDLVADPSTTTAPFLITPPINRIDVGKGQALRIILNRNQSLASDRETLFWLNVLDIPVKPTDGTNYLQFAIRNRLKLFYRPTHLNITQEQAISNLKAERLNKNTLVITNTSPYYLNFAKSHIVSSLGTSNEIPDLTIIEPFTNQHIQIEKLAEAKTAVFSIINDYGSVTKIEKSF